MNRILHLAFEVGARTAIAFGMAPPAAHDPEAAGESRARRPDW